MWHLSTCPNSGLLLETVSHRRGQPSQVQSLLLPWGQSCHGRAYPPPQVPLRHGVAEAWLLFLQLVTYIPRQYWVSGWPGDGCLTRDQDGEWEGALPDVPFSPRLFWLLGGVRAQPSIWRLAPVIQSSKLLDLVAIDTTVVVVNWNSGLVCTIQVQRPLQEIKKPLSLC